MILSEGNKRKNLNTFFSIQKQSYILSFLISACYPETENSYFNFIFSDSKCGNYNRNCEEWARLGECTKNPDYMTIYCPQACHSCRLGKFMIEMCLNMQLDDHEISLLRFLRIWSVAHNA
jgi:hypothetical protein